MWTPDYRQPTQNDLLWVYEGQAHFWGYVLAARSGVQSRDMVLGQFANIAGTLAAQPGRGWRSLEDTTLDPIVAARKPKPFASLARGEEYYGEGAMIWLEADQLIRAGTRGRKGLDDFARAFFGLRDGELGQLTFEFEDVVAALNAVYPHDWAEFLKARVEQANRPAPLAGIERAGYQLVWREELNPYDRGRAADTSTLPLTFSLGLTLDKDGKVTATQWGGPAFAAGIVNGARITAVGGKAYAPETLRAAITAAKTTRTPIQLIVQRGEAFSTIAVPYYDGLRHPWLERKPGAAAAGLDLLLAPRRAGA
jgi:predicted metalloprotease with PDZ domain